MFRPPMNVGLRGPRSLLRHPRLAHGPTHFPSRSLATSPSGPAPTSYKLPGILALSLISASIGLYLWERQTADPLTPTSSADTFSFKLRGPSGVQEYTFPKRPESETEAILRVNETSHEVGRRGNPVLRWDRNWLGSNEPPEDRSAIDVIPRGPAQAKSSWFGLQQVAGNPGEGTRDLMMFSVLDGHAGDATSKLLAKALHPTLGLALASLQAGHVPSAPGAGLKALSGYLNPLAWFGGKAWSQENVALSLQTAFLQLDDNICQTPLRLLPSLSDQSNQNTSPTPAQVFMALSGPADAGAVVCSTVVDAENEDLYVAVTGDCRAVAGWQNKEGKWRCDVLTEDQMGENPREIQRVQSEHPASERANVIRSGRMQGGLQPTRAFGDASYKWTPSEHAAVVAAYQSEGKRARGQRPGTFTPPYVTARPEVTHRKVKPSNGDTLRFIIMSTDGLWDRITSEEATLLVASYLSHPNHPDIPKTILPDQFPLLSPPTNRPYPAQDLPGSKSRSEGAWVFEGDKNAATHLIRNSLHGADRISRNQLLSIHGRVSRDLRDDMTVTVVFFDEKR